MTKDEMWGPVLDPPTFHKFYPHASSSCMPILFPRQETVGFSGLISRGVESAALAGAPSCPFLAESSWAIRKHYGVLSPPKPHRAGRAEMIVLLV